MNVPQDGDDETRPRKQMRVSTMGDGGGDVEKGEEDRPMTIGVFGGSFNPIHLGHVLLAITTKQTKPVDKVVLVPVFKHAVKTDLLPYEDRVKMCELAMSGAGAGGVEVSTIERDVGESNAAMLKALKQRYPPNSKLWWICGDDVFDWIERPKGVATMKEVTGLIVQRRLHKGSGDRFFKAPINESKIRAMADRLSLEIDFIYGELPHFSSTLVRRAPGSWRAFLPQTVSRFLESRPDLIAQLHANLEADAQKEQPKTKDINDVDENGPSMSCVIMGVEAMHMLQYERGQTGLWLSMGTAQAEADLVEAQAQTDTVLGEIASSEENLLGFEEALALEMELKAISTWLKHDRKVAKKRSPALVRLTGPQGWTERYALLEKFNTRIDVILGATIRALSEILAFYDGTDKTTKSHLENAPELLRKWSEGKESLGRLRAFVCAGGPTAFSVVRNSFELRQRLDHIIEAKERKITILLSSGEQNLSTPAALLRILEQVTAAEWSLMGCFARSTPLPLVHKLLLSNQVKASPQSGESSNGVVLSSPNFDVEDFFATTSGAIDLMLTVVKALAAAGCARA
eukprot:scaffold73105_cov49-Attheya_sp.AAC.5